jgi:HNH endonuclease
MLSLAERFWAKVEIGIGCWLWRGATGTGYGVIRRGRAGEGMLQAHRVAYEMLVGPIPVGMEIDHLCRVRACVNPAHLEPVTHRENDLRGVGACAINARKVYCNKGHLFTPENTRMETHGRRCRECMKTWRRAHAKKRGIVQF